MTAAGCDKYLSGALVIWTMTCDRVKKFFCCQCSDLDYPAFLWVLFKQNAKVTILYYLLFLVFGMCVGILGPSLLDLSCIMKETTPTVTWAFFAQSCCTVFGVVLGGFISKYISADFLLLVAGSTLPIYILILSFAQWLELFSVIMALMGISLGVIDCLANLQLVTLYDKAVAPFLQAMHFFYGVGALISPLIIEPFLLNVDCSKFGNVANGTNTTTIDTFEKAQEQTRIYQAYWIMAAVQVPIILLMTTVVGRDGFRVCAISKKFKLLINSESRPILPKTEKEAELEEKKRKQTMWNNYMNEVKGSSPTPFWKMATIMVSSCLIVFIYDGLQGNTNEFLNDYGVNMATAEVNKSSFSYLNAYFWGAYAFGRLISIILAMKFTPHFMLLISMIGCQLSIIVYMLDEHNEHIMSVATVLLGLFMSNVTPTAITLTEYFIDISNVHMSMIIGAAALGEMSIPLVESKLIDDNPRSFVLLMLCLVGVSWVVFGLLWSIGRLTEKYQALNSSSLVWCDSEAFSEVKLGAESTELDNYTGSEDGSSISQAPNCSNEDPINTTEKTTDSS